MNKLSDKTKEELLDIIDRKDRIEQELRDKIDNLNSKINNFNKIYKERTKLENLDIQYNTLKNDYENICDILATERTIYKNNKIIYIAIIITLVVALISTIIMMI